MSWKISTATVHGIAAEKSEERFYPQLFCPEGQYSDFGQIFFLPFKTSLKLIFHLGETVDPSAPQFNPKALGLYHTVIFVLMTWTYGVGAPSGLFVPSLTLGAAMGRLYGRAVMAILNHAGERSIHKQTACGA